MRLLKVINKAKTTKGKDGKEHYVSYFAIEHDNGKKTLIKPCYKDDYKSLEFVAEVVVYEKR